jgi:hypothetical protein
VGERLCVIRGAGSGLVVRKWQGCRPLLSSGVLRGISQAMQEIKDWLRDIPRKGQHPSSSAFGWPP